MTGYLDLMSPEFAANDSQIVLTGQFKMSAKEAYPLGIRVEEHFVAWFTQSYGVAPAVAYPELAASVIRALYDTEFLAHVDESGCRVVFAFGVEAAPVECLAVGRVDHD